MKNLTNLLVVLLSLVISGCATTNIRSENKPGKDRPPEQKERPVTVDWSGIKKTVKKFDVILDVNSSRNYRGKSKGGLSRIYRKDPDTVWTAVIEALNDAGIPLSRADKAKGILITDWVKRKGSGKRGLYRVKEGRYKYKVRVAAVPSETPKMGNAETRISINFDEWEEKIASSYPTFWTRTFIWSEDALLPDENGLLYLFKNIEHLLRNSQRSGKTERVVRVRNKSTPGTKKLMKGSLPPIIFSGTVGGKFPIAKKHFFTITSTGDIRIKLTWPKEDDLTITLNGPGQAGYLQRKTGFSPLKIEYSVSKKQLSPDIEWTVTVINFSRGEVNYRLYLEYP